MVWVRDEIALLFSQIHNVTVLSRLECCGHDISLERQQSNINAFWNLTVATASERSWYMLNYSYSFPEMLAGLLDHITTFGNDCLDRFIQMGKALCDAEEAMNDPTNQDRIVAGQVNNIFIQLLYFSDHLLNYLFLAFVCNLSR